MRFSRCFALAAFASATLVLVACVGDTPVTPVPEAGIDSSPTNDAAADTSLPDSSPDTSTDATSDVVDAAPCINTALVGNTINLPTSGNFTFFPNSEAMTSGDYKLTSAFYSCNACTTKAGSAVGGLKITVTGPNVVVERHIDVQVSGDPQQSVVDRWSGTFDQINSTLKLTRECPGSAVSANWTASFKASTKTVQIDFPPPELQTKETNNTPISPTWVFTKP